MSGTPHNTFAKDLLGTLLQPLGKVEIDLETITDRSTLEVHFIPQRQPLTTKPKASRKCVLRVPPLKHFNHPSKTLNTAIPCEESSMFMRKWLLKLFRQIKDRPKTNELPRLWIITTTWGEKNIEDTNSHCSEEWGQGIYLAADIFRTGVIVADRLPKTPDTVWFRMLGQGTIQQEAINEIAALPQGNPERQKVLELFMSIKHNSETGLI